ncbi:MarR family transcriptional regulator [Rhodococcus hoagii]|uniref:MarR family transcriptional regulator n=2 Tax=Rhodococcus hoagii TaxID=43767 RepID=A0A9Q2SXW8_RHOHA|nr:MarR family transcriptional regulator [Prescottella equi]MBU4614330.1 MarR family transcriptional regulator [Rhodococcus sp. GG48]MCD7051814.1 MarR family transcriptional regulator [Rhodococcus sp. BH2-1]MBM4473383.1 MarR family transcriptional regulator [Prescottella equi]MBM4481094.1 MarR family transcriptional regulator [Prescottella equi]MBM4490953.1 MarR family transcriptional regulator [Prescottella equi]
MNGDEGRSAQAAEGSATPSPGSLDFWSFIDLANTRLSTEFGSTHQLATQVLLTLNRAANVVTYDLESSVHRPRGLSWSAFRLLFVTWLAGPIEPKSAAKLTGMSRAAVSNLAKTLVASGLIERSPDARDGRSVQLSLTEQGRTEMAATYREHNEREYAWASVLTEAEQHILVMLLDKLITNRSQFDVRGRN